MAAFLVVIQHAYAVDSPLDPTFHLTGAWQFSAPGHLSVLVFFLLSGYVIGLSTARPLVTSPDRRLYLRKRVVRLYPLYLISLGLTIVVSALRQMELPAATLGGGLLFLQGLVVGVPDANQPVWSLSYEMLYYLLFLVVSARQWPAERVAAFFFALGLLLSQTHVVPLVVVSYCYGAVFWFVGLYLCQLPRNVTSPEYGTLLAFLLLMVCFERLNLGYRVFTALHLDVTAADAPLFFDRPIIFSDFSSLVYCVPLLLCFTNRTIGGQRWLEILAFAVPGLYSLAFLVTDKSAQQHVVDTLYVPLCFYAAALLAYFLRYRLTAWGEVVMEKLKPLGLISYGIYIIHFPLMFLLANVSTQTGTLPTFLVRLALYLVMVVGLGWLLETKLQPWCKKKLMPFPK